MDARELVMLRYDAVHGGFVDDLFTGIAEEQLRRRPHGVNSVAWLVWHAARVEDAVMSRFVVDRPQVLDEGGWNARLRLDRRDVGPGMTGADVDALSAEIDVGALRAYRRAVSERTRAIVAALPETAWGEPVPAPRVREEVAREGLLIDGGRWVEEFWAQGRPRGWYVLQVALLHPYGHYFDAMVTRGLLGVGRA
jgi:hypothetical protein